MTRPIINFVVDLPYRPQPEPLDENTVYASELAGRPTFFHVFSSKPGKIIQLERPWIARKLDVAGRKCFMLTGMPIGAIRAVGSIVVAIFAALGCLYAKLTGDNKKYLACRLVVTLAMNELARGIFLEFFGSLKNLHDEFDMNVDKVSSFPHGQYAMYHESDPSLLLYSKKKLEEDARIEAVDQYEYLD